MAQWLGAFAALVESHSLVPRTHARLPITSAPYVPKAPGLQKNLYLPAHTHTHMYN